MSAEITIESGVQSGRKSILTANKMAIMKAIGKSLRETRAELIGTVPRKTGATRQGYRNAVINITNSIRRQGEDFIIRGSDVLEFIEELTPDYTNYHIRESPNFNRQFDGGYIEPTTSGTEPISIKAFMQILRRRIIANLAPQQRAQGLDAT